jgi:hypothetical protein
MAHGTFSTFAIDVSVPYRYIRLKRRDRTSGRNKYYSFNENKRQQIRLSRSARRKTDGARRQDALKWS